MFPWFCLFSLSFQWEEVQKFPGTLFLGTFFFFLILGGSSPAQKVLISLVSRDVSNFLAPTRSTWKTPTQLDNIRTKKFGFWVLFSSLNFLIPETPAWKSGFVTPWAKCCKLRTYFMTLLDNIRTKKFGFGFFFPPWLSPLNWGGRAQKKKKTANKWF